MALSWHLPGHRPQARELAQMQIQKPTRALQLVVAQPAFQLQPPGHRLRHRHRMPTNKAP